MHGVWVEISGWRVLSGLSGASCGASDRPQVVGRYQSRAPRVRLAHKGPGGGWPQNITGLPRAYFPQDRGGRDEPKLKGVETMYPNAETRSKGPLWGPEGVMRGGRARGKSKKIETPNQSPREMA